MRNWLSPGLWEACAGIWPECAWTRSVLYVYLLTLGTDITFSACLRSRGRLPNASSGWSGGLLLTLGDAAEDAILNGKAAMHAELDGILIYMGGKDHGLAGGCQRTAAPTCAASRVTSSVLEAVLDEACGRVS